MYYQTKSSRVLITAPTDDVISLENCKASLGITSSKQDDLIDASIGAAVTSLDAASGGWLGRALRPQTWELRLDRFPWLRDGYYDNNYYDSSCCEIRLPYPPLTSVTSIKYIDAAGVEHMLVENTDYRVIGTGGNKFGSVIQAYNKSWPSARYDAESVKIRYVCGYAPEQDSPFIADKMPAAIKQAIALMVRSITSVSERNPFISRASVDGVGDVGYVVSQNGIDVMKQAAESLLGPYEVLSV